MTAGTAAACPTAVACSASAMPGATTARFVVCDFEMPMKLFMMPQTVPNSPTKGEMAPTVASSPMPTRTRRASARTISVKTDAARSLMPESLGMPCDSRSYAIAAFSSDDRTFFDAPSASCASASDFAPETLRRPPRTLACSMENSMLLAIRMVQVASDASASPTITALTRMSAFQNIVHGDNSCRPAVSDLAARPPPSTGASEGGAMVASGAPLGAACATAASCGLVFGAIGCAALCDVDKNTRSASNGDITDASANSRTSVVLDQNIVFILQPSSGSDCDRCRSV